MKWLAGVRVCVLAAAVPAALLGQWHVRWANGASILVWVDPADAPAGAIALVDRAVSTWSAAIGPLVTLQRANSQANAGIRVRFARSRGEYGETRPQVDPASGTIRSADVVITIDTGGDDPMTQRIVLYLTALHSSATPSACGTPMISPTSCTASGDRTTGTDTSRHIGGGCGHRTISARARRAVCRSTTWRRHATCTAGEAAAFSPTHASRRRYILWSPDLS
jgi:hypothetical protein